jgi:hypothetical protein
LVNICLLPFAYVKALLHKCVLYYGKRTNRQLRSLFIFLAIGPFVLVIAAITDMITFIAQAYEFEEKSATTFAISLAAFKKFCHIVDEVEELVCPAQHIVKQLKEAFKPELAAIEILYGNLQKHNKSTTMQANEARAIETHKISRTEHSLECHLRCLKTFNTLKDVVLGCRLKMGEKGNKNLVNV